MAQEAPPIQNKKLIVIAILLGAVVVVVYNVHISGIRKATEGRKVRLLEVNRDMEPGEKITAKDLDVRELHERIVENLTSPVREDEREYIVRNAVLNQPVTKGQLLLWGHITGDKETNPSAKITPGMVAVALELDPQKSLGNILRVGDRVNVVGYLPTGGAGYEASRIIQAVKVHTIGGLGRAEAVGRGRRPRSPEGMRSFRSVTVEVPVDESLKLYNVLSHVRGGVVWLELRFADEPSPPITENEKVNPDLKKLATTAAQGPP